MLDPIKFLAERRAEPVLPPAPVPVPVVFAETPYDGTSDPSEHVTREQLEALAVRYQEASDEHHRNAGLGISKALRGEPFAPVGARNAFLRNMACEILDEFPFARADSIAEHFSASLDRMARENNVPGNPAPTMREFVSMLERHAGKAQSQHAFRLELGACVDAAYAWLRSRTNQPDREPFNAPGFLSELQTLASRCRDKHLKPSLQAIAQGKPFPKADLAALASKIGTNFPRLDPSDVARALQHALDNSGVQVEEFAKAIEAAISAIPRIDASADWARGLRKNDEGKVLPSLANALHLLRTHPEFAGRLAFDGLKHDVIFANSDGSSGAWTAEEGTWLRDRMIRETGAEFKKADITDAVVAVAKIQTSHPVQIYLSGLAWDGVPRLDQWLVTYCRAEDNPYTRAVAAKWMISAVARAFQPGCKVDTMLILQNPKQGTFKSTTFATLVPDAAWYSDTALNVEDRKDAAMQLFGKWIYEIGELHGFSRADANRVKGFMSSKSDNVRAPYAARTEDFPRGCVFGGTTNEETYLTDETGNRRFWPVTVGVCDVASLERDRDQLWAEAVQRYRAREPWWLDEAGEALAAKETAARMVEDAWEGPIRLWLANPRMRNAYNADIGPFEITRGFTTADVLEHALGVPVAQHDRAKQTRIGATLKALGCTTKGKPRRYHVG